MAQSDLTSCRTLLRRGSRSFALATRLLPGPVADSATGLYAFCRVADDLIDDAPDTAARERALADLRARLDGVYGGRPHDHAADRALAAVVRHHGIPRHLPEGLLEGFAWDAEGRRYETLADLEAYAWRVAGTVGAMLCLIMGDRRESQLRRAGDLGIAMQLTNVARDVGSDAAAGRLYLPLGWFRGAGLDAGAWLRDPQPLPAVTDMVERLLQRADTLYSRADTAVEALPRSCRRGIRVARLVYADIGRVIRARGGDSVSGRAVVPLRRQLALLLRGLRGAPVGWSRALELLLRLDRRSRALSGAGGPRAASGP